MTKEDGKKIIKRGIWLDMKYNNKTGLTLATTRA